MDYAESLAYANYWRKDILPYLRHLSSGTISFSEYLAALYKSPTQIKTFGAPIPYIYSLEFLKKYQKKCFSFHYNAPDEVAKGLSFLSAIYQFSPRLHGIANIYIWRDEGKNEGHVTVFLIYEKMEDLLEFVDDNIAIVKEPKEKQVGFALHSQQESMQENPLIN